MWGCLPRSKAHPQLAGKASKNLIPFLAGWKHKHRSADVAGKRREKCVLAIADRGGHQRNCVGEASLETAPHVQNLRNDDQAGGVEGFGLSSAVEAVELQFPSKRVRVLVALVTVEAAAGVGQKIARSGVNRNRQAVLHHPSAADPGLEAFDGRLVETKRLQELVARVKTLELEGENTTDAFAAYYEHIMEFLGWRVRYAQIKKVYAENTKEERRRYSPARTVGTELVQLYGYPDPARISTSHVERQNLNFRLFIKRMTRLTMGFSKSWRNLKAAIALFVVHHNFCKLHTTTRVTPAMSLGVEPRPWKMAELLTRAATY